jgi:hypothetical protein
LILEDSSSKIEVSLLGVITLRAFNDARASWTGTTVSIKHKKGMTMRSTITAAVTQALGRHPLRDESPSLCARSSKTLRDAA